MPHVDAPAGAPSTPEAVMPVTLAAGPLEAGAVATGPYRIAIGCSFEPSRDGSREGR
jgi:hypothetical protein